MDFSTEKPNWETGSEYISPEQVTVRLWGRDEAFAKSERYLKLYYLNKIDMIIPSGHYYFPTPVRNPVSTVFSRSSGGCP